MFRNGNDNDEKLTHFGDRSLLKILALALLVAISTYLFLSSPEGVVVSTEGEVIGFFNKARSHLQRENFWEQQLSEVNRSLEWERSTPERRAKLDALIDLREKNSEKQMEKVEKITEEIYERNPRLRPSSAHIEIKRLRKLADEIEEAEFKRTLDGLRQSRMLKLEKIVQVIQSRGQ